VQHEIVIRSYNLTLKNTVDMQEELLPAVLGWLKKDEV
jgi:hypothetical protein